jgi:hypothetical protein
VVAANASDNTAIIKVLISKPPAVNDASDLPIIKLLISKILAQSLANGTGWKEPMWCSSAEMPIRGVRVSIALPFEARG